jgi:serine/threonine protein kinase/TolB-like protein
MMSAGEWERIKSLFDAVISISREERGSWLDQACAGSPELRDTLEQLLRTYDESSDSDPREVELAPVFSPGQLVANRFSIVRLIARGGMGEVYEALDGSLNGLRVALKTIRTSVAPQRLAYERFKREVWVAREIAHDGICRIYDLVEHKETAQDGAERVVPCLTMKLLDGETLGAYLARKRPLQPKEALPLIRQIVKALEVMHAKGIVHRDLKPSNVMLVGADGGAPPRAVVTDFGLAKPLTGRSVLWETRTEEQAGAPYFLAPEILRGGKAGLGADLYALGLIIDEMVTTSPAFPHDSIEQLFLKKLHAAPEPPSARAEGLPENWEQTILWCLDTDPERRPQTAAQVLEHLENPEARRPELLSPIAEPAMELVPRTAAVLLPTEPVVKAGPVRRLWRRSWILAAALMLLLLVAGVVAQTSTSVESSIAVFPFVNLTRQKDYDYLCTGTSDELMRRLIYIDGLRVYPVREEQIAAGLARQKARFSLEGNLQHYQGRIRLSVQIIDNESGALVWSDHFERELMNPLALQSDIAENMVRTLNEHVLQNGGLGARLQLAARDLGSPARRLFGYEKSGLPSQATQSSSAFDEYARGRQLWQERTLPATLAAIEHFKRAVVEDPKFALAYAALSDSQHTLLTYNYDATSKLLSASREYAERAVDLDPSLPEVHVSLGAVRQMLWDWNGSEASYRRAIAAQPKFARAHQWYAGLLLQFGRFDEALEHSRHALELDPFDFPNQSSYGLYLWNAGRLREAASHLERTVAQKDLQYAHTVLGQVYAALAASSAEPEATDFFVKSLREAGAVRTRELEAAGGADSAGFLKWSDLMFAQAHAARGDRASAQVYVDRLESGLRAGRLSASAVAWAQAAAGNYTRTLELLQMGLERQEREMMNVKVIPLFRPLHNDPRFQAVLRQMRLSI